MKKTKDFTAWDDWDARDVEPQPEPAISRPDYMDWGRKPVETAQKATPITLVRKPAVSADSKPQKPARRSA